MKNRILISVVVATVLLLGVSCGNEDVEIVSFLPGYDKSSKSQSSISSVKSLETDIQTDDLNGETDHRTETNAKSMFVYVCGAVNNPGVYEMTPGSRVYQAIEAAGGLTQDANPQSINQAAELTDAEMITVRTYDEVIDVIDGTAQGNGETANDGKININIAEAEELMTLPGIGKSRADAIIEYREQNGGFASVEDIQNITGIKEKMFEKIKDKIKV